MFGGIEDFKNLKDFTINFETQENLSIIIGNNGSGKVKQLQLDHCREEKLYHLKLVKYF